MTSLTPITPLSGFTVRDVMSVDVGTVRSQASLIEAWQLLFASGRMSLLVVDNGRCIGVLDDRRVALEWPSGAFESRWRTVASMLGRDAALTTPSTPVEEIAELMVAEGVGAIAVAGPRGQPVGLVTCADLVRLMARAGLARPIGVG